MKTPIALRLVTVLVFTFYPSSARAQGDLTPPDVPMPTMKTLDQVEARTPVDDVHTPGDAGSSFIISQSGSYYLTANITGVSGKIGITIAASDVTLDLNGFALIGPGDGSAAGISASTVRNLAVRQGTVRSWAQGVSASQATNSLFEKLRVSDNAGTGIAIGPDCEAFNCMLQDNGAGIVAGTNCTVTSSSLQGGAAAGITVGDGSTVLGCTIKAPSGNGLVAGKGCTINNCTVTGSGNNGVSLSEGTTITNCTSSQNAGHGFAFFAPANSRGCTIKGCTASLNGFHGLVVSSNCLIVNNTFTKNGTNGPGDGIQTSSSNNRIDSNHLIGNSANGIQSSSASADYIIRNTAFGNTLGNYNPTSGTYIGPNGASITPSTSTNPWANF